MPEFLTPPGDIPEEYSTDYVLDKFFNREIYRNLRRASDPYESAYCQALMDDYQKSTEASGGSRYYADLIAEGFARRNALARSSMYLSPNGLFYLVRALTNRYARMKEVAGGKTEEPIYPTAAYHQPERYRDAFRFVVDNPFYQEMFLGDMMTRSVQTSVDRRAIIAKLLAYSERERLGENYSVISIGPGNMSGELLMLENKPFEPVKFLYPKAPEVQHEIGLRLNEAASMPMAIGAMLCVDVFDPRDRSFHEHILSCGRANETARDGFTTLEEHSARAARQTGLARYTGELTVNGIVYFPIPKTPPGLTSNYDLALHEAHTPIEQRDQTPSLALFLTSSSYFDEELKKSFPRVMLENGYIKEDGLIVVADHMYKSGNSWGYYASRTKPFTYRTLAFGLNCPLAESLKPEVVFSSDGRFKRAQIEEGFSQTTLGKEIESDLAA